MNRRCVLLALGAPLVGLSRLPAVAADRATVTVLAEVRATPIGAWPQIGLLRIATASAASLAVPGYGTGSLLLYVETGRLAVRSAARRMELIPGSAATPESQAAGVEVTLEAGDAVRLYPGEDWWFRTEGDAKTAVLGAALGASLPQFVRERMAPATPAAGGIAAEVLAWTNVDVDYGLEPGTLQLAKVTVAQGAQLENRMFPDEPGFEDPGLFYVERGELTITAGSGGYGVSVWQGAGPGRPLQPGERATVLAGDGFYFRPGGAGDVLNTGLGDCELLAARYDTTLVIYD